jgi:hypothetical protein
MEAVKLKGSMEELLERKRHLEEDIKRLRASGRTDIAKQLGVQLGVVNQEIRQRSRHTVARPQEPQEDVDALWSSLHPYTQEVLSRGEPAGSFLAPFMLPVKLAAAGGAAYGTYKAYDHYASMPQHRYATGVVRFTDHQGMADAMREALGEANLGVWREIGVLDTALAKLEQEAYTVTLTGGAVHLFAPEGRHVTDDKVAEEAGRLRRPTPVIFKNERVPTVLFHPDPHAHEHVMLWLPF